MPELPEVETTRRGLVPALIGRHICALDLRPVHLRVPLVPEDFAELVGVRIGAVRRRAKYLIVETTGKSLLIHLGMTGNCRILPASAPALAHQHAAFILDDGQSLRFVDARRFGLLLAFHPQEPPSLLEHLGPEPLSKDFLFEPFFALARGKRKPVKTFLLDNRAVVGVGNIYAAESLFAAGIHPLTPVGQLSRAQMLRLFAAIPTILRQSLEQGGTTLRDFHHSDGRPGYFQQTLMVYGRAGQACRHCQTRLENVLIAGRQSVFCPRCQAAEKQLP